jgi:hypothetical protein
VTASKWSEIKHKANVAERPPAIEFSCRPWTPLALDGHAAAMSRILTALEADPRAIGPVVSFDDKTEILDALFQVARALLEARRRLSLQLVNRIRHGSGTAPLQDHPLAQPRADGTSATQLRSANVVGSQVVRSCA